VFTHNKYGLPFSNFCWIIVKKKKKKETELSEIYAINVYFTLENKTVFQATLFLVQSQPRRNTSNGVNLYSPFLYIISVHQRFSVLVIFTRSKWKNHSLSSYPLFQSRFIIYIYKYTLYIFFRLSFSNLTEMLLYVFNVCVLNTFCFTFGSMNYSRLTHW
jgi:hypothetical protein